MSSIIVNTKNEIKINILEMLVKGGWIMIPIVILFFISMSIIIERILVLRKVSSDSKVFIERIKDYIQDRDIKSAKKLCQKINTPYSHIIEKIIQHSESTINDILVIVGNIASTELAKLEKGFVWIATTAAIAPMLGFLGTVIGMLQSFFDIANTCDSVSITLLSSSIYKALVTTVAGLFVGIPTLFGYNFLVSKVDSISIEIEVCIMDFISLLT